MARYRAIALLNLEVSEILPTNESSGKLVSQAELEQFDLRKYMTVAVEGESKEDCLLKLKERINEFGRR